MSTNRNHVGLTECILPYSVGFRQKPINMPCVSRQGKDNSLYMGSFSGNGTRGNFRTRNTKGRRNKFRRSNSRRRRSNSKRRRSTSKRRRSNSRRR